MRRLLGTIAAALLTCIPIGFIVAAIWVAKTNSYSEKLGLTDVFLCFATPAIGFVAWLAYDALTGRDRT